MLRIYTDGSGGKIDTPGGWACVVVCDDEIIKTITGGKELTSVNRMELTAFINALEYLKTTDIKGKIITDSQYVQMGVEHWLENWKILNFFNIKNENYWKHINRLIYKDKVQFKVEWMRGHQKDRKNDDVRYNAIADKLAGLERRKVVDKIKQNG